MQNIAQGSSSDGQKVEKVNILDLGKSSTPHSSNSSTTKSETDTFAENERMLSSSSESEEDGVSEVSEIESFVINPDDLGEEVQIGLSKQSSDEAEHAVDPETQQRLEALLEAAGIGKFSAGDGKHLSDPEVLRRLTSSVSCALDEAAAALTRMRTENQRPQPDTRSLVEACSDGDVGTVKKLLTEGRSVHETTEEGESLLSLACSAGYYELAQVLIAMNANVEDRGIKGDCTPLMEAASNGHVDIVRLLIAHGADVNAQSSSGNTPLMYSCAGGYNEVVKVFLEAGANVEDHNENGHTPLMEAASAGHVAVAKVLLEHGAGINTHSNEFKESALTLACYKGHLDMVRFLLEAGADQEHKTDEMHTALMEASMDGHVEVAKLLLDSGAQVNMPTDSFESPLTLAACGGHVDLAMLLIERGANIEEVNDEGYTPLMEAAREGHEEMVALLLSQGANINAQTEETQETALTLACCGGFSEVADFLLKAGADLELGSSTPLMEAAQEGHLELVRYLLDQSADVRAHTQTGDTALTYACENGHTDVADLLLQYGSDLEHESEGGRTPLMKACRAGHLCTVKFLIQKGADVNRQSTNNDHTPLSLASAGGHLAVVEHLLKHAADPFHKLKDNSTMLIEAAKGGHTSVVQLLLDYPHSIMMSGQQQPITQPSQQPPQPPPPQQLQVSPVQQTPSVQQQMPVVSQTNTKQPILIPFHHLPIEQQAQQQQSTQQSPQPQVHQPLPQTQALQSSQVQTHFTQTQLVQLQHQQHEAVMQFHLSPQNESVLQLRHLAYKQTEDSPTTQFRQVQQSSASVQTAGLIEVPEAVKAASPEEVNPAAVLSVGSPTRNGSQQILNDGNLSTFVVNCAADSNEPFKPHRKNRAAPTNSQITSAEVQQAKNVPPNDPGAPLSKEESNILDKGSTGSPKTKQLISELERVGEELTDGVAKELPDPQTLVSNLPPFPSTSVGLQHPLYTRKGLTSTASSSSCASTTTVTTTPTRQPGEVPSNVSSNAPAVYLPPPPSTPPQPLPSSADVVQSTAISDRPKAKPAMKKEGKNARKQQQIVQAVTRELAFQAAQMTQAPQGTPGQNARQQRMCPSPAAANLHNLQINNQQIESQLQQPLSVPEEECPSDGKATPTGLLTRGQLLAHLQQLDPAIAATPHQLHDHVHQVLHQNPSLKFQQMLPHVGDDTLQLLSDQKFFAAAAAAAAQAGGDLFDREQFANAVANSLANLEEITSEDASGAPAITEEALQAIGQLQDMKIPTCLPIPPGWEHVLQPYHNHPSMDLSALPPGITAEITANRVAGIMAGMIAGAATAAAPPNAFQPQLLSQSPQFVLPPSDSPSPVPLPPTVPLPSQAPPTAPSPATSGPVALPPPVPIAAPSPVPVTLQTSTAPAPTSVPVFASAAATSTTNTAAQTTQPHHHAPTCSSHQVQASTQTTAPLTGEKKVTNTLQNTPAKGKKARFQVQSRQQQQQPQQAQSQQQGLNPQDANAAAGQYPAQCAQAPVSSLNVDSETESNHDTALTLACAGGHDELVELLLSRGSDIEHRDKKGFTPLILAATAGHHKVVEILLEHGADIEAQSERTKDTPLSLACSGGRYEVVDLLLTRGANKEHRNVSDYTPLSLAASGGYVNIIKLLLAHAAEINSRTGSKLGISPLMLAAMNGHTAAVKLLLDMGSDINAQIETNRNTALTLACFQGRHEVVSLLLDRKANVEHRAKTGLTPLMEAASGGYVEVGRVLLDKGADVNAPPVPSSRDTGLTIAADKGHCRFVELLLSRGAQVEVKNKKGNSPLWLAANGGHLNVVELLYNAGADIDSQDNRKVSCLMAAFRKGHNKVVKWMVHHVMQFPSDQEMTRYVATINDKELLEKCQDCIKIIRAAKDQQADKANKNASILLEELDMEKTREESKRLAAQRRRERKKKKKQEKKKQLGSSAENENENENDDDGEAETEDKEDESEREYEVTSAVPESRSPVRAVTDTVDKEEGDSGIDANSQGSCSSSDVKAKERRKDKKKKTNSRLTATSSNKAEKENNPPHNVVTNNRVNPAPGPNTRIPEERTSERRTVTNVPTASTTTATISRSSTAVDRQERKTKNETKTSSVSTVSLVYEATARHPAEREDFEATGNETYMPVSKSKKMSQLYNCGDVCRSHYDNDCGKGSSSTSPKQSGKRDEGWKEVVRKSKKVSVPLNAISRVIGRGGSNINAIRAATGAQIEVEKQCKGQGERIITIKGSADATRQAHMLIAALIKDPDVDLLGMLPKPLKPTTIMWDKAVPTTMKLKTTVSSVSTKVSTVTTTVAPTSLLGAAPCLTKLVPSSGAPGVVATPLLPSLRSAASKLMTTYTPPVTRGTAPRLVAAAEKRAAILAASNTKTTMSYTSAIMTSGRNPTKGNIAMTTQTFAAKLSETAGTVNPPTSITTSATIKNRPLHVPPAATAPVTPQVSTVPSPKHHRPPPTASAPPSISAHYKGQNTHGHPHSILASTGSSIIPPATGALNSSASMRSSSPAQGVSAPIQQDGEVGASSAPTPLTYSLFNTDTKTMWNRDNEVNNQKGMNFASVAAAGSVSANVSHSAPFLITTPPPVDLSKAPGYRGNTTCSPVSSKPCSNTSSPPSLNTVDHSTASPVKPPQLLAISRPVCAETQSAPLQSPKPSPVLRPGLEIQPPDLSLTVNRSHDMQHSPSGLAVQRPSKDSSQPLASPQQAQQVPLAMQQPPPQLQQAPPLQPPPPIGGLHVNRQLEMQHSPNRNPSVEMQTSPPTPQGPPSQPPPQIPPPSHVNNHLSSGLAIQRPNSMDIQRPVSMEIPPSGPLNQGLVMRPNSMESMSLQRPSPLELQQSPQAPSQNQPQPPQRMDMPPTDLNSGYNVRQTYQDGNHDNSSLYNPPDALLSIVPGMTDALLNNAVSMSRLNPRAPDFSSSLHHTNKPPPHPPMFQSGPPYLPPNMLPPMPNKFHQHPPPRPGNAHNRWPYMPHGFQPDGPNYNVLAGLASLGHPSEMMQLQENGNSPPSPNHGAGAGGDAPHKAPPRPIGTERHFKHHMAGDAEWLMGMQQQQPPPPPPQTEHKLPWAGPQMFRSNPIPTYELPPIDSSFQLGMEGQFHNGGNAAAVTLSALHHTIPMMTPYNANAGAGSFSGDMGAHDSMKIDASNWEGPPRLGVPELSDKQHGWTAKWNH